MGKLTFNIDTEEDRQKIYDLFDSFSSKKQIFEYFGVCDNTENTRKIREVGKIIGFDFEVYKERQNPSRFCLQCGRKLKKGQEKFCCSSCAAKYNNERRVVSDDQKQKVSKSLKKYNKENPREGALYRYECERCGEVFFTHRKIKEDRHHYCPKCKQEVGRKYIEMVDSILELPKTTMIKILKKAKCKCAICGWNEATCDVHHIVPRKDGGPDSNDNLIVVCPNHHRILHTKNNQYPIEYLKGLSIENEYKNWKDFYWQIKENRDT